MTFKRLLGIAMAVAAVAMLVGSVGAGAARTPAKRATDLSTNVGVKAYLHSLGISSRGVVIQRGARNYAGPNCPGKRWTCTASHRVVQIATGHGKNRFRCSRSRCVVVQAAKSLFATNTAKCIRNTGITQSCSITQSSTSDDNEAIVVELANKTSGLTQNASQTASITQTSSSGRNTACVMQTTTIDGSTTAKRGVPVTVSLNAHQTASITQNSHTGGNTVQNASASGTCATGGLNQTQTITSTARGSANITQLQNATDSGPNMLLKIQQNQADTFKGSASGASSAAWSQTNTLTAFAIAATSAGPVTQVQSSDNGGLEANVKQFSTTPSVIDSHQTETQCERAVVSPATPSCATAQPALPAGWSQTQTGPMRKGPDSTQEGSDQHQFMVDQDSTQTAAGSGNVDQSNVVEGACATDGNCTVDETTTVQGDMTHNVQSGQTVSTGITCSGSDCEPAPAIVFDGSPGTGAPPSTLGPYTMTPFGADPQPLCPNEGASVTGVADPAGTIAFSQAVQHDQATGPCWATWSHGYTGDVYDTIGSVDPTSVTITLPAGTRAFYLYAEPNVFDVFDITATAQDGTTSTIPVQGNAGAQYFGFYATGTANILSITVSTTADAGGFAVGEFGIATQAPPIE